MACNFAINFANNLLSWSASVPFLPSPSGTEFLAHAPVKLNAVLAHVCKDINNLGTTASHISMQTQDINVRANMSSGDIYRTMGGLI